jgi:flagellar basal body-associated protein FliL
MEQLNDSSLPPIELPQASAQHKSNVSLILGIVVLLAIVGIVSFVLGANSQKKQDYNAIVPSPSLVQKELSPTAGNQQQNPVQPDIHTIDTTNWKT